MPVNVKLLKKVRKLIAEEPRRLSMRTWGRRTGKREIKAPPCGTVACLAGWTAIAAIPKMENFRGNLSKYLHDTEGGWLNETAANLLGIPLSDCPFYNFKWKAPEVLAWIDRQIDAASK